MHATLHFRSVARSATQKHCAGVLHHIVNSMYREQFGQWPIILVWSVSCPIKTAWNFLPGTTFVPKKRHCCSRPFFFVSRGMTLASKRKATDASLVGTCICQSHPEAMLLRFEGTIASTHSVVSCSGCGVDSSAN